MPTENRSSNTEQMVSVPQALATRITGESYQESLRAVGELRDFLAQPAAQHQGEPIVVEAVTVTREDDDEGLRLEWLLEGGIAALEFPGQVLLVAHGKVTDDNGSGEVYLHPPTSDGFSAGDMADQGAKAFRDGQRAGALPGPDHLAEIIRKVDGNHSLGAGAMADAILEEVRRLNEAAISPE